MSEPQPVSSAPLNGTKIIGWCARERQWVVVHTPEWAQGQDEYSVDTVWDISYPDTYDYDRPEITHWLPYPEEP